MPATLASVTAVLKERYEGGLNKQLRQEVPTLRRIERTSKGVTRDIGGRWAVFAIHTKRNQGIGARKENELLPKPGQQGTEAGRVGLKYLYGALGMTGQTFELANSNPEAFIDAMDLERDGLKDDLAIDMNRQVWGDGTGTLAVLTAIAGSVATVSAIQYLQEDMQVDILTSAGAVKAADRKITNVTETANGAGTFVIGGAAVTFAAGDFLVRTGNYQNEWTGLQAIARNTGSLYNIDPATVPVWKGEYNTAGADRAVSEGLMMSFYTKLKKNGGKPSVIFTTPGVWQSYWQLLSQQRQFVNTTEFTGGFKGLAFMTPDGEIPVVQDFDAPRGKMLFLDEDKIKIYREHDFKFMDRDASMWVRRQGYDGYDATMYQYSELGTVRRNAHGMMDRLIETGL